MSNTVSYEDVITRLAAQSDAIGRLAQDAGGFSAVVAAFEANDPNAFRWVLERLEMLPRCELICEWIRIKLCVLRCIEVCGPPPEKLEIPDLRQFAAAIVKLTADDDHLRRAIEAVACGDGRAFHAVLTELGILVHCHLICRWICAITSHRICELVCTAGPILVADALTEARTAGKVIATVVANEKAFTAISRAALTLDCEIARSAIEQAGFTRHCEIICGLICVWRCAWVCLELCRFPPPILTGVYAVEEARNFALASLQLAGQPRALGELVQAVRNRNVEAYAEIISRYRLAPYCLQVCAWVCSVICYEFCFCICQNKGVQPWFTTVGYFDIVTDIDPVTGKTNKGLALPPLAYNGGPNFAFCHELQLGGFCPIDSPTSPGIGMKYRFLYTLPGGSPAVITDTLLSRVVAGTRFIDWPQMNLAGNAEAALAPTFQSVVITSGPPPAEPIPPLPGAPWYGPSAHYIVPDPVTGWVVVDPNVIGGGFQTLLGFDTKKVPALAGGPPLPGVNAGTAVPGGTQRMGTDIAITFEATRVTTFPPGSTADHSNSLAKIHINNWDEVNELWFAEYEVPTKCCTPIDQHLSVQFTVDHEEMDAGTWSLVITSCSASAPGDITPHAPAPAGVILSDRGGSGTIVENTSGWDACSYTATLTTRPGLTTGLQDRGANPDSLTFCICGHNVTRPTGTGRA